VESEFADAGIVKPPGNGEQRRDAGQVAMKGGVETGDLRDVREGIAKGLDEGDFAREVSQIERLIATKFGDQIRRDDLMIDEMDAAMDDAMADTGDGGLADLFVEEFDEPFGGEAIAVVADGLLLARAMFAGFDDEACAGLADAFDLSDERADGRRGRGEEGELDAGRAAVDGEDERAFGHDSLADILF